MKNLSSPLALVMTVLAIVALVAPVHANDPDLDTNNPGVYEPVMSHLLGTDIRIPNSDQSSDGVNQNNIEGEVVLVDALGTLSSLGHTITKVSSPNDDMQAALLAMANAASAGDAAGMQAQATELEDILLGTTEGRIYDGFSMLNFNRWTDSRIDATHFQDGIVPDEYKMKVARDSGETYIGPYTGEERKIWEVDVDMLYYDGQIDSDTFLLKFPFGHHDEDTLKVNYTIYSLVQEDFSPTMVMLDWREALDTVSFPYKGIDSVWVAFDEGERMELTVKYPPIRQIRGVYTWGWRVHPPRIQFMQPVYEIFNVQTGEAELDAQSRSYAYRNRTDLTYDNIGNAAPEKKMMRVVDAILASGATPAQVDAWLTDANAGPRGTWIDWADLATNQQQLPAEAWDILEEEDDLSIGQVGDYHVISAFLNNEMYGTSNWVNEVQEWDQREKLRVKIINLDNHRHYYRNVDFSDRLNDDIADCCGGNFTSFEVMNFKPFYGAPKVAEMQWRAGWGFRPHNDVIQQPQVFPRGRDRMTLEPYTDGGGDYHYGFQYGAQARGGDFRFNPPTFIIGDVGADSEFQLADSDGELGLLIGQRTPGYGEMQMCPDDPPGDFCQTDFGPHNPFGALNWPEPNNPDVEKTELRFPAFLRNPAQGDPAAGDIIPPTGAWRPFLWISPYNGTLWVDPDDESQGFWADRTYAHGAPVEPLASRLIHIEAPRAAGQVFYQFDDLFHDNSIFSPHPLTNNEPTDETDDVENLMAKMFGPGLGAKGTLTRFLPTLSFARWASLYDGPAGEKGCTGEILGVTRIETGGEFQFRLEGTEVPVGSTICVESLAGGFAEAVVR